MGQTSTLQEKITVTGDTSIDAFSLTQSMDEFLDVSGWGAVFITVHTFSVDAASGDVIDINFPTVDSRRTGGLDIVPYGAAGPCAGFTVSSNEWYKTFVDLTVEPLGSGTFPIENLLGWNLNIEPSSGGGPFSVTFEIFVTLKRPV